MAKAKIGRPPKIPSEEGRRVSLGLRVTPTTKLRLDKAAAISGRSQSQEAELRLEHSFAREDRFPKLAGDIYGDTLAGAVLATGKALNLLGKIAHYSVHFEKGERVAIEHGRWNDYGCKVVSQAASLLLEILANPDATDKTERLLHSSPPQEEDFIVTYYDPAAPNLRKSEPRYSGKALAAVWMVLRGITGQTGQEFDNEWRPIRELLGPIAEKLAAYKEKPNAR